MASPPGLRMEEDVKVYLSGSLIVLIIELIMGTPPLMALFFAVFSWGWLFYRTLMVLLTGEIYDYSNPS